MGVPVLKHCPMCGFNAISKDMLVFFPKKGRGIQKDFCIICYALYTYPLVKCKVCGLKAWTKEDLKRFVRRTGTKHGRSHLCWECQERTNKKEYENKRERLLGLIADMAEDEHLAKRSRKVIHV